MFLLKKINLNKAVHQKLWRCNEDLYSMTDRCACTHIINYAHTHTPLMCRHTQICCRAADGKCLMMEYEDKKGEMVGKILKGEFVKQMFSNNECLQFRVHNLFGISNSMTFHEFPWPKKSNSMTFRTILWNEHIWSKNENFKERTTLVSLLPSTNRAVSYNIVEMVYYLVSYRLIAKKYTSRLMKLPCVQNTNGSLV